MGGVGKTTSAIAVAHSDQVRQTFGADNIWWITVGQKSSGMAVLEEFARKVRACRAVNPPVYSSRVLLYLRVCVCVCVCVLLCACVSIYGCVIYMHTRIYWICKYPAFACVCHFHP